MRITYWVCRFLLIYCVFASTGCSHNEIYKNLHCVSDSNSHTCERLREEANKKKENASKDDAFYACVGNSDSDACRQATEKLDEENRKKAKLDPNKDIKTAKDIVTTRDEKYAKFEAQSQNKEWIVLKGVGGNFSEIKNVVTGESRYWHGDEHESSHIKAIANDGKMIAYLYGGINFENKDGEYQIVLHDLIEHKNLSKINTNEFPDFISVSPIGNFLVVCCKINKSNSGLSIYSIDKKLSSLNLYKKIQINGNIKNDSYFQFSADEERFFVLNKKSEFNLYEVKSGFLATPSPVKLLERHISGSKAVFRDEVASASFIGTSSRLAILVNGEVLENKGAKTYGELLSRKLMLFLERDDRSYVSNTLGIFPYALPAVFTLSPTKQENLLMITRESQFEFQFIHFGLNGKVEKYTKCCFDNKTQPQSSLNFPMQKFSTFNIDGAWVNSDKLFRIFLSDKESVFYPVQIEEGQWKRVAKW